MKLLRTNLNNTSLVEDDIDASKFVKHFKLHQNTLAFDALMDLPMQTAGHSILVYFNRAFRESKSKTFQNK